MKAFRAIYSLTLALLVLISSTSFQVCMHFCQGEVREIALFGKAPGCEKERELPPCHRHAKSSCCDDETVVHDADELTSLTHTLNVATPNEVFTIVPFMLISEVIPDSSASRYPFIHYRPPLPASDLTVAYRTLII